MLGLIHDHWGRSSIIRPKDGRLEQEGGSPMAEQIEVSATPMFDGSGNVVYTATVVENGEATQGSGWSAEQAIADARSK
jgi:hypothetical protein